MAATALKLATKMAKLTVGQTLRGIAGKYILMKQLEECVWSATNQDNQNVIVKSVRHWRLQNERDLLKRFQHRTPFLRPIIDEIEDPADTPSIVLRWLDDDVLQASDSKRLTRPEVKQVAKGVLEALKVLHEDGYIHADVKPKNILVNYGTENTRFKEVQLADLGGTIHKDSQLQLELGPSMDIWSFGATLLSLIFGGGFHIFMPTIPQSDPRYHLHVLLRHFRIFGPWPASYNEIADEERIEIINYTTGISSGESLRPFKYLEDEELLEEDKEFFLKFMKLDPRDRPTAKELLEDEWFWEHRIPITISQNMNVSPLPPTMATPGGSMLKGMHKVWKSEPVGQIFKDKKRVVFEVATHTSQWTRTPATAKAQGPEVVKVMEDNADVIPKGTNKLIVRDNEHVSDADPQPHFSVVVVNANGSTSTVHMYAKDNPGEDTK